MATSDIESQAEMDSPRGIESRLWRRFWRFAWDGIRLPVLMLLRMVEPVARFFLSAVALLGILVSLFLEFSGADPRFPFWLVLGLSLSCGALVILLNAVMRRLAR